jgi:hypothetical protein
MRQERQKTHEHPQSGQPVRGPRSWNLGCPEYEAGLLQIDFNIHNQTQEGRTFISLMVLQSRNCVHSKVYSGSRMLTVPETCVL